MRIDITLDDELVREAMRHSQAQTIRGLIEEALRSFIRVKGDERRKAIYAERLKALRPELDRVRVSESPSSVLRRDRDSH